ncbi:related to non-ribosomal peptide synthetase [Rhynchosporium graminicola]|uniref:Related to non-ribosomal peptide synthetase n=1 Tax=Rhynchosporium graminicola TaxID=2792576 RepID=A0A1E1KEA2_9HELO|nr:related to non-ribosomal peptide synthetase [Rhynchosporium commune]
MIDSFQGLEGLNSAEQVLFNQFGHGQNVETPFGTIHGAIESKVDQLPNSIAVEQDGGSLTYQELERAANGLANRLITMGLEPQQRVCLVVQRSLPMAIAILAVLKAGCQYVPLDGQVTAESALRHIMKDTQAPFVLCLEKFYEKVQQLSEPCARIVVLDSSTLEKPRSTLRPNLPVSHSDGAYCIYTSGSTGPPKGVDVTHGNVTNLLCSYPGNLNIQQGTNVAQLLSISFDMAQWEILGTLINGATLLIRTSKWEPVLSRAHTIISTPSILATFPRKAYPNIKVVAVAGEPCPKVLADEWVSQAEFFNCCGPTEVTIVNTMHRHRTGSELSIGKPVPNTSVYILDEDENPVPIGQTGLMWVGGASVSRGYLNLPEFTSTRYKNDKFNNSESEMFNTGDLCRWNTDGTISYEGRADDQVKIKGFRVELDSVAASMEAAPFVTKACAIFSEKVLWGFYSGPQGAEEATVRSAVEQRQPYYAVPSKLVFIGTLPMTSNGKIDKRALLASIVGGTPTITRKRTELSKPQPALVASEKQYMQMIVGPPSIYSSSDSENDNPEEFSLPQKKGRHGIRALRHRVLSLYRRLFTIVFVVNIVAVCLMVFFGRTGKGLQNISTAIATNLTLAVLMRQEYVINALFTIACAVPTSWPIWIRRNCAKIYHIGGLHSGCAVFSLIWLIIFTVGTTINSPDPAALVVSYLIIALMLAMVGTAHPTMRQKYHDRFELVHRFVGWTALALFWAQTVVVTNSGRGIKSLSAALVASPGFWLLTTATTSVILPWLHLRKVTVRADILSQHAVRLYFTYANPVSGTAIRLSERPLIEWHAFATIAKPGDKEFSVIVSNAGDWTKRQIQKGPTKMWVRGIPACGVLRIVPLFRSIVLVASGSGIGPCLPVIYAKKVSCRIFWSTPHPEQNFGKEIMDAIKDADPNAVIHNTKTQGRPDMVAITYRLLRESGAEAIAIISNKKLTQMVVYAMEARGVPAFGAIFDS